MHLLPPCVLFAVLAHTAALARGEVAAKGDNRRQVLQQLGLKIDTQGKNGSLASF